MPKQLSSLDAQFLALETDRNYGHVGSVAILDPSTAGPDGFSLERIKAMLAEREHMLPPFTRRLAEVPLGLDWPYWVRDEHFDLGYHCRELALPAPGSMEQLREQVARIYSRQLDRSRPLWELYLIHGLERGRVALMTKIHHAAVDGMSGGEILTLMYDLTPEPRAPEPVEQEAEDGAASGRDMLVRTVTSLPGAPARLVRRAGRLLPHVDVVPSVLGIPGSETISRALSRVRGGPNVIERPAIRPPKGVYDGRVSPHRVFGLTSISLSDVKRVKDHFGVKVNDVVVALVAGALREDLQAGDALPESPLVAQIPVSVRTDDERRTFGNQISVMFVPIPTHLDTPGARVRDAAEHLRAAKERHGALPAKALRDVTQFIPPALHARAARTIVEVTPRLGLRPPYNLVISNVPGPPMDIYTAGARLEALYPLSIITDGATLNVTLMSYRDSIDIAITADRELTPDVQAIAERFGAELAELVALCSAPVAGAQGQGDAGD